MSVLLIDTFSAFFRAHYALPAMKTRAGEPTSALYGFSVLILKLLREHPGSALARRIHEAREIKRIAIKNYQSSPAPLQKILPE